MIIESVAERRDPLKPGGGGGGGGGWGGGGNPDLVEGLVKVCWSRSVLDAAKAGGL